ncbi:MAG: galactokinase [Gemmatimonadaceae bacterium]|jgi:galactokinase|nr:galactokinase [Gemmatimonadaceae bacterium]
MSREAVESLFTMAYGYRPAVVTSAPGRVNLIGEHTDYNGGEVLPIAIAQRTWVAIAPARTAMSRAVSRERGEVGTWDSAYGAATGTWWDYVAGALAESASLGSRPHGHDVAVVSDVPMGAGLSSSAALQVATVLAALALDGIRVDAEGEGGRAPSMRDVALAAHRAETGFVGVACGIMDQFASALCRRGHALHLHCDTGVSHAVPFDRGVLIVDTMTPRALRDSDFNARRAECTAALEILRRIDPTLDALAHASPALLDRAALPDPEGKRARHVVSETHRVRDFVALCGTADAHDRQGHLLNASHRSLRLDYECSTPELDWVVEHCVARVGIDGARLTGAGWGGCAIVMGDEATLGDFASGLAAAFHLAWMRTPRTWVTTPHDGARIER